MNFPFILVFFFGAMLVASTYAARILNRARLKRSLRNESDPYLIIENLEKIVADDPDDYKSWFTLIDAYTSSGSFEDAIRRLGDLIAKASGKKGFDAARANAALADCYMKTNRLDDAFKAYAAVHRYEPENPMPFAQMGRIERERGNADKAIHYLGKARALAPGDVDILKDLAVLTHDRLGGAEAHEMFKSVLEARPDDGESHFRIGQIEMHLRNFKAAYTHFVKSKDSKEFAVASLVNIGVILSGFKKYDAAKKVFAAALRFPSIGREDMLEIRYRLGETLLASKDVHGAIEQWEKILATVREYRDVSEKVERYEHTKSNALLHAYMICSSQDFAGLCERVAKNYAKNVIVIRSEHQRDQSLELYTQASYKDVSGPLLFKFYRGTANVGQLAVREFYEKLREMKAKFGVCFTTTEYTEEAQAFALGRVIELRGRRELARLLSKKLPH